MVQEKVLLESLNWLNEHFKFENGLFKEENVINAIINSNIIIPDKNCLECDEFISTDIALKICELLNYRKNLNINNLVRLKLFEEKTGIKYEMAYNLYIPKLEYFFKKKFGISNEDAEDVSRDTLMQALSKIELYDKKFGGFDKWIYSIGKNIQKGTIKKFKSKGTDENIVVKKISIDTIINEDSSTTLKDRVLYMGNETKNKEKNEILLDILDDIINELPEKYKKVIILNLKYRYKYLDIQEALSNVTLNMVNWIIKYYFNGYSNDEIKELINNNFKKIKILYNNHTNEEILYNINDNHDDILVLNDIKCDIINYIKNNYNSVEIKEKIYNNKEERKKIIYISRKDYKDIIILDDYYTNEEIINIIQNYSNEMIILNNEYHENKIIDDIIIDQIIEKYYKYYKEIIVDIINKLYNGQSYISNHEKLDVMTIYIDYLMNNGIEFNDEGDFSKISDDIKFDIIDKYITEKYNSVLKLISDKIYDSMAFNLSTIKTQIKLGKKKIKNKYDDIYNQNKFDIENEYYDAFDINNFNLCTCISSFMMN